MASLETLAMEVQVLQDLLVMRPAEAVVRGGLLVNETS